MVVKFEAFTEDLVHEKTVLRAGLGCLGHFQLDVKIAVTTVRDHHGKRFAKANSNSSKIKFIRWNSNLSIASSSNNLQILRCCSKNIPWKNWISIVVSHWRAWTWIKEPNRVLFEVEEVPGEERNCNLVFFLTQRSEVSHYIYGFIGLQQNLTWLKSDLILILFRNSPFIFHCNPRIILHLELLFCLHADECWGEEQFVLGKANCWCVTGTLDLHLLHIYLRVVENELGSEIVESWRFRTELDHNNLERLPSDEAALRKNFKSVCWILKSFELHGGVASVGNLDSFIYWLVRTAGLHCNSVWT